MIGNMTGASSWQKSARKDKQAAVGEMSAAKQQSDQEADYDSRNPTALKAEGNVQGIAGGLTRCSGMQDRGPEKRQAASQKALEK